MGQSSNKEISEMFDNLTQLAKDGHLTAPKQEIVPLENFKDALEKSAKGFKNAKFILKMPE